MENVVCSASSRKTEEILADLNSKYSRVTNASRSQAEGVYIPMPPGGSLSSKALEQRESLQRLARLVLLADLMAALTEPPKPNPELIVQLWESHDDWRANATDQEIPALKHLAEFLASLTTAA